MCAPGTLAAVLHFFFSSVLSFADSGGLKRVILTGKCTMATRNRGLSLSKGVDERDGSVGTVGGDRNAPPGWECWWVFRLVWQRVVAIEM